MTYPTNQDNFTNPTANTKMDDIPHSVQHSQSNDAIEAIETKIGTGASTPTAGKVLRATGAGTSAWGAVDASTDVTGLGTEIVHAGVNAPANPYDGMLWWDTDDNGTPANNSALIKDTIDEFTAGAGVTVDGVLLKDGKIPETALPTATIAKLALTDTFRFRCNTGGARTTIAGADAVLPGFSNNTITPAANGIIFGNMVMMCFGTSGATQIWLYINGVSRKTDFGAMYFESAHWQTFTIPFELDVTAGTTYTIGAWCNSTGNASVCNSSTDQQYPTEINGILVSRG